MRLPEPDEPSSDDLPAEPTPPRTRPSRASMRSPPSRGRRGAGPPTRRPAGRGGRPRDEPLEPRARTPGMHQRPRPVAGSTGSPRDCSRAPSDSSAPCWRRAEFNAESRPGAAELVDLAVNVLSAAATTAGMPAEDVERQVAEALAFLRRRLSGDYEVDEFGFDEDYTDNVLLPLLRLLYQNWFRVEVLGVENIPAVGGALVVGNHSGTVALDSLMTQVAVHDEHPQHRHLRLLGADLVFRMPFVGAGPQVRRHPRLQPRRRAAAQQRRARRRLPGGLQGRRQALQRALQAAALRPRRLRLGGAARRRADRAGVDRRRRGDLPDHRQHAGGRPAARPALRPDHPDVPVARPAGLVPLPSKWLIEFGDADRHRRPSARTPPTTRCSSSTSPTRSARPSNRPSTACSCSASPSSSDLSRAPHWGRAAAGSRQDLRRQRQGHRGARLSVTDGSGIVAQGSVTPPPPIPMFEDVTPTAAGSPSPRAG